LAPQSLNRYTYVMNNPLKYTDPTGEFWFKNPIGDWWDSLDPNWKVAITFAVLTMAVIATAGLAAPLFGIAAAGIMSTMVTGALVMGAVSGLAYLGISLATGQEVSLSGFAASFATGAFLGAVGSVAGMAGGSIARGFGHTATSSLARLISYSIVSGVSVFTDVVRAGVAGEPIDPGAIAINMGLSGLALKGSVRLMPTQGMTTFRQAAQGFAPHRWAAFAKVFLSPSTAGTNAKSLIYGPMLQGELITFSGAAYRWYVETYG